MSTLAGTPGFEAAPARAAVRAKAMPTASPDLGDLHVHLAAVTVLKRCRQPISELEVAVVLETCGYNASRVRAAGASSLMELAAQVYALAPMYAGAAPADNNSSRPPRPDGPAPGAVETGTGLSSPQRWRRALAITRSFARGLAFTTPLLVNLATMLVAGVSLWSSRVELAPIAASMTLATCLALISTGPFIHAFGRRASLYLGLGDEGMLAYLTRRALGTGMLVALLVCGSAFLLRAGLSPATPPAANRLGLAAGLAIAALQVGLAPFYLRDALWPMVGIVGGAGAALAWHVSHLGTFIDPVDLAVWQVRLVALMAGATWLADGWWLLRLRPAPLARARARASRQARSGVRPAPGLGRTDRRIWLPSGPAVARAVAPYASYGLAYFVLVCLPQLVSGGAWHGRYQFNGPFSLASGVGLVGIVPMAGTGMVAAERLVRRALPLALSRERISEVERVRSALVRHWRRQLAYAVVVGALTAGVIDIVMPALATPWLDAHGMAAAPGLLYLCSAAYFLFSLGTFASQLLFSMACPGRPVVAVMAGAVAMLASSAVLSQTGWCSLPTAAAVAFLFGSAVFALLSVAAGEKAFSEADFTCYRAL